MDNITATDVRNLFRLKNENKTIENKIIKDTNNLFGHEEEDYYKPLRVDNF